MSYGPLSLALAILTRLARAPDVVIYDFACALMEYALNREPEYFKYTLFLLDGLHKWNHSACSPAFRIRWRYGGLTLTVDNWIDLVNTQSCEQWNSIFANKALSLSQSNQATVMREARLVARQETRHPPDSRENDCATHCYCSMAPLAL